MRYVDLPSVVHTPRVASVDALRGLNMFWIMGFDGAMVALAQMSEGKGPLVHAAGGFLGTQFQHVAWEGLEILRSDLSVVRLPDRRLDRAVAAAPGRTRRQGQGSSAGAAPVAVAVPVGAHRLWRHQRALGGHPLARRIAADRALLLFHVADVLELQSTGLDCRRCRPFGRLLGAFDLCPGSGKRRGLVRC